MVDVFIEPVTLVHAINVKLILALKLLESCFNMLANQSIHLVGLHAWNCPDTELSDQGGGD
jgi:hypothetical protein